MHTSSGLIHEIAHGIEVAEAEKQILAYLSSVGVLPGKSPLAGNSVSVDRNFIARDMKALADFLHYRTIDVSTIKELSRRWYPKAYFAAPAKTGNHRALGDIKDSIEELKYYRSAVFTNKAAENKPAKNRFLNIGPWRVK
jgi:oligoribonuclease